MKNKIDKFNNKLGNEERSMKNSDSLESIRNTQKPNDASNKPSVPKRFESVNQVPPPQKYINNIQKKPLQKPINTSSQRNIQQQVSIPLTPKDASQKHNHQSPIPTPQQSTHTSPSPTPTPQQSTHTPPSPTPSKQRTHNNIDNLYLRFFMYLRIIDPILLNVLQWLIFTVIFTLLPLALDFLRLIGNQRGYIDPKLLIYHGELVLISAAIIAETIGEIVVKVKKTNSFVLMSFGISCILLFLSAGIYVLMKGEADFLDKSNISEFSILEQMSTFIYISIYVYLATIVIGFFLKLRRSTQE